MSDTSFVYVTYIRTTPEKLWQALTTQEFLSQYWQQGPAGVDPEVGAAVQWEVGSEVRDLDQVVLESEPYRRLCYSWHTYQREWSEMFGWPGSEMLKGVSGGWPQILASLKSLLETGRPSPGPDRPSGSAAVRPPGVGQRDPGRGAGLR